MKGLKSVPQASQARPILMKKGGTGLHISQTEKKKNCLPRENFLWVPLENFKANPDQPRKFMDDESFKFLVDSIRQHGFLQPIVACPEPNNQYTIVAGHRRFDAAREIGMHKVPVFLMDVKGDGFLIKALVENIQRENLHCVDLVRALKELRDRVGHLKIVAEMVGMGYAAVRQYLRAEQLGTEILDEARKLPNISRNDLLRLLELSPEEGLRVLCEARVGPSSSEFQEVDKAEACIAAGTSQLVDDLEAQADIESPVPTSARPNFRPPVVPMPYKQTTLDIRSSGKRVVELQIRFFDGRSGSLDELESVLLDALSKIREERQKLATPIAKKATAS